MTNKRSLGPRLRAQTDLLLDTLSTGFLHVASCANIKLVLNKDIYNSYITL